MNHSISSSSLRRNQRQDSDSKKIDNLTNGASCVSIDFHSQQKQMHSILQRLINIYEKKTSNAKLRAFLLINSSVKPDINSPTSYKSKNLTSSRLSSNTFVENSLLNNTFSEHSSISCGRSAIRELIGIVGKKILFSKIHPFQRLKKYLIFQRQSRKQTQKGLELLRIFQISYIRGLKQQAFSKMVKVVLSTVRSQKSSLKMYLKSSLKKAGQHLIKVLQKARKSAISRIFSHLKKHMYSLRKVSKIERLLIRKEKQSIAKSKRLMWNRLREIYTKSCGQYKSVSLGFRHFQRIYLRKLKICWMNIHSKAKSTRLLPIRNKLFCKSLDILRVKTLFFGFNKLSNLRDILRSSQQVINKTKEQCKLEQQQSRKIQFAHLEECLEQTEHALKIETIQNQKLTKKQIQMEKQIGDLTRQLKNLRLNACRLERELKQKDTLIRKLLQQQNTFSQAIRRQRIQIDAFKTDRNFQCECCSLVAMEMIDLVSVQQKVQSIVDKYVSNQQVITNVEMSVKKQFEYFKDCLQPISKLLDALCLNPLFKNQYPSLCQIRNDYVDLTKFVGHSQQKCLSFLSLQGFTKRIRNVHDKGDVASADIITYELTQNFGQNDGLIRAKILEFVKNSELYSRQLRKTMEKNTLLKSFWIRLDACQNQLLFHGNKTVIEMGVSRPSEQKQLPQWNQAYLSKLLFQFIHPETPYNVRIHLKNKMESMLNIQPSNSY